MRIDAMARRGRPRKDERDRRTEPVSIRMAKSLRAALEAERQTNGRSLSQEIEVRLIESFDLGRTDKERFGGADLFWLFRVFADQIADIEFQTRRKFRDDAYTFNQVKECFDILLDFFKPS